MGVFVVLYGIYDDLCLGFTSGWVYVWDIFSDSLENPRNNSSMDLYSMFSRNWMWGIGNYWDVSMDLVDFVYDIYLDLLVLEYVMNTRYPLVI